jgi:hypothetical protein
MGSASDPTRNGPDVQKVVEIDSSSFIFILLKYIFTFTSENLRRESQRDIDKMYSKLLVSILFFSNYCTPLSTDNLRREIGYAKISTF